MPVPPSHCCNRIQGLLGQHIPNPNYLIQLWNWVWEWAVNPTQDLVLQYNATDLYRVLGWAGFVPGTFKLYLSFLWPGLIVFRNQ